ncbi:MAG: hypothetical protein K1X94_25520 [Sandaracinaceae bacterium]|nr:hypothetical protein [Sandaracinaceae bacterium]
MNVSSITKHLPKGLSLPARFEELVRAARDGTRGGYFDLGWRNPRDLHGSRVMGELGVFLTLPDGGVVALWASGEAPPVVHVDSEVGARVIARDFEDFLSRLARQKTAVPDLDALEERTEPLALGSRSTAPRSFASIQKAFARALAEGEPEIRWSDEMESVRAALVELGAAMVKDRLLRRDLTRMVGPRDDWSVRLRATRVGAGWTFEYTNEAAWHPLPERYGMPQLWERVRARCKRPGAELFHLEIAKRGLVRSTATNSSSRSREA